MPVPVVASYKRSTYFAAANVQSTLPSGAVEGDIQVVMKWWWGR